MTTFDRDSARHQCINASCGCNDGVTAGACSEWCQANTTEAADLERGKATAENCGCGHPLCAQNRASGERGTRERGMG